MLKIPENGHIGEEEGRRKKHIEENEPSAARPKSKDFRCEAGLCRVKISKKFSNREKDTPLSAIPPMEITVKACNATEMEYV
jgi:hypothetical protein